jgi:hypothetical protein
MPLMKIVILEPIAPRLYCPKCGTTQVTIHNHDDPFTRPGDMEPMPDDPGECHCCDFKGIRTDFSSPLRD